MKTLKDKIRIKKWKPIYVALASGQEFETQKGMKAVAPKMDHNLPMILIRLGYISPEPPYRMAKKIWDWNKVISELRDYYEKWRSETASDPLGLNKPLAKSTGPTLNSEELAAYRLTEDLAWNGWKMPTMEETKEKIKAKRAEELKKFWDADLVTELRRRGYEVTAKKTVEL